ncbi:MAG TPA: hypothetical protein VN327_01055, partial [Pseudonocardiaceae bacterium]|nr:hypothetical protein [Pseudonocardiaceae bacterium]
MSSTARQGVRTGMPANGGEAASLVESAMLLRWRAPELALLLADRAVTAAQDDKMAVLQADHLAVFALNRLGRHGEAVHRLFPAIRDADTPPGLRHELHVELAHCAVALGEPVTALGAVHAVLAAGDDVAPVLRGRALVAVAEASVALGRDDLATSALDEADELYREDPSLDHDTALLLQAAARAADAVRHRHRDAAAEAEAKAREGRELLVGLADPEHDSGEVSARLMLEMVLALLDRDAGDVATQEVRPLLRRPVRAAAAGAVGRLQLALATRVHLAEGRHEPALTLLADAVEGTQRHGVDAVLAECLEGLSHVHEARGEFADALHCMRAARAAEGRHRRDVEAARSTLLENCGTARHEEARLVDQVAVLLGNSGMGCIGLDSATGSLSAECAVGVAAHQTAESAVAESESLQLSAPTLMPAAAGVSLGESGVPSSEPVVPPAVGKPAVEDPGPVSQEPTDVQSAESPSGLDPWQTGARHRRGAGTLVSVSDLLPVSALSSGRSGRRRAVETAEDRAEETPAAEVHQIGDEGAETASAGPREAADRPAASSIPAVTYPSLVQPQSDSSATVEGEAADSVPSEDTENVPPTRRELPVSGPPPAPTPRALEWEPVDGDSAGEEEPRQMGLGDLLAEALAAYQESRDIHADASSTGVRGNDGSTAADAETSRDLPRYRVLGTRWAAGLALAPKPIDGDKDDPS